MEVEALMEDSKNKFKADAGFYNPELRSKQMMPWMQGNEYSYLQEAAERMEEIKAFNRPFDCDPKYRLRNQEMYTGGYTFEMESNKNPDE